MYSTMDAIAHGGLLWANLRTIWPMSFILGPDEFAVIVDHDGSLSLMVGCVSYEHICVQIRKEPPAIDDELEVDINIDGRGHFISGSFYGLRSDELGCMDALQMFAPLICGEWKVDSINPFSEVNHRE